VRGVEWRGRVEGFFARKGNLRAIVAPSGWVQLQAGLCRGSGSSALPHELQNLPFVDTLHRNFEQNMGGGGSNHACKFPGIC